MIVVENNAQLQKIVKVWEQLPKLKAIVQYTGEVAERRDNIYSVSIAYQRLERERVVLQNTSPVH